MVALHVVHSAQVLEPHDIDSFIEKVACDAAYLKWKRREIYVHT